MVAAVLVRRLRHRATAGQRRALAPLYTYGVLAVLWVALSISALTRYVGVDPLIVMPLTAAASCTPACRWRSLPAMLRGGFARTGELEELAAWLARRGAARATCAALWPRARRRPALTRRVRASTVHEGPAAEWVDAVGRPVQRCRPEDAERAVVRRSTGTAGEVAVVVHDRALRAGSRARASPSGGSSRIAARPRAAHRGAARGRTDELRALPGPARASSGDERAAPHRAGPARRAPGQPGAPGSWTAGRLGDRGRDVPDVLAPRRRICAAASTRRRPSCAGSSTGVHARGARRARARGGASRTSSDLHAAADHAVHVSRRADGELSPTVETTAYFVVVEALTNAVKHSRADEDRGRRGPRRSRTGCASRSPTTGSGDRAGWVAAPACAASPTAPDVSGGTLRPSTATARTRHASSSWRCRAGR